MARLPLGHPRLPFARALACCLILLELGCTEGRSARQRFGASYSCPEDRIQVTPRPDLSAHELVFGSEPAAQPPKEVAQDPERYAIWKKEQAKSSNYTPYDSAHDVLEVVGCDHARLFICSPWTQGNHFYANCSDRSAAPAPGDPKG